jgi:hypothetical protein
MILAGKTCASVVEPLRAWFNFTATRYEDLTEESRGTVGRRHIPAAGGGLEPPEKLKYT